MQTAEHAEQAAAEAPKEELDLDALDAAAAAHDPQVAAGDEITPSSEDVAGELPEDEFDRAVDAEPSEHAEA
jgi:hypothetical protein